MRDAVSEIFSGATLAYGDEPAEGPWKVEDAPAFWALPDAEYATLTGNYVSEGQARTPVPVSPQSDWED